MSEWKRLILRATGGGNERLSYESNDWLMRTMKNQCRKSSVTAVHSYEDCSLLQFEEAKRRGKACIYDLPIGLYSSWEKTQESLAREFADWLPEGGLPSSRFVRPEQKLAEASLADLVLVPSTFVEQTVREHYPEKTLALAPYGVDLDFWTAPHERGRERALTFIYAGQISLRKGIPLLVEAWERAAIPDAELHLVGLWQLSESKRTALPANVVVLPPCSPLELRDRYRRADVFVFPSYFEGFGLVLLEAMACGLPAIASDATAGPDVLTQGSGRVIPRGDIASLSGALAAFAHSRHLLPQFSAAARQRAEAFTWSSYRSAVSRAVAPFL